MLTQDQIIAAYEHAIANDERSAGQDVREASESISRALDDYCTAIQFETFLWAYELGFKAGQGAAPAEDDQEEREEEGWI